MSNAKQKMTEVIQSQPDDATYEEIMRELAFERMVARGLEKKSGSNSSFDFMKMILPLKNARRS